MIDLSNKAYDITKYLVTIGLPALGSAYFALATLLSLPYGKEVVGTLSILATLLGTLMRVSSDQREDNFDGILEKTGEDEDTGIPDLKMTITSFPQDLTNAKSVRFKVVDGTAA